MTDRDTNDSKAAQQPVMMPVYFPPPQDEIDLFELVEQLWRGKFTILGTMVLALVFGAGVSVFSVKSTASVKPTALLSTEYTVSTTFRHLLYPILAQQICRGSVPCLDDQANRDLSKFIGDDWLLSDGNLSITTDLPFSAQQYDEQLTSIVDAATDKILTDARSELVIISAAHAEIIRINKPNPAFSGTQRFAENWLNATRVITAVTSGTPAIAFKPVTISSPKEPKEPKDKTLIIIAMSVILGGMLGSITVLFKNALESRRKQSSV
jgi:capsular polysaccharide biosynthesis protein